MLAETTSAPFVNTSVSPALIVPLLSTSMTARVMVPGPTARTLAPLARKRTWSVKVTRVRHGEVVEHTSLTSYDGRIAAGVRGNSQARNV